MEKGVLRCLAAVLIFALTAPLMLLHGGAMMVMETPDVWQGDIATELGGGVGTEEHPFIIASGSQLAYMAQVVNAANDYIHSRGQIVGESEVLTRSAVKLVSLGKNSEGVAATDYIYADTADGRYLYRFDNGTAQQVSSASGKQTVYTYDIAGRVYYTLGTKPVQPGESLTAYAYDPETLEWTEAAASVCCTEGGHYWFDAMDFAPYDGEDPSTYTTRTAGKYTGYSFTLGEGDEAVTLMLYSEWFAPEDPVILSRYISDDGNAYLWEQKRDNYLHPRADCIRQSDGSVTVSFDPDDTVTTGIYTKAYYRLSRDIIFNEDYESYLDWMTIDEGAVGSGNPYRLQVSEKTHHTVATIGTGAVNAFDGVFDGGGHTLYGMLGLGNSGQGALFGFVTGYIKNINISHSRFYSWGNGSSGYMGSIACRLYDGGEISGCTVSDSCVDSFTYAGGIVAYIGDYTNARQSVIRDCVFRGSVTAYGGAASSAGGICAGLGGAGGYYLFENCRVLGNISSNANAAGMTNSGQSNPRGTMIDCINYATVCGKTNAGGMNTSSGTTSSRFLLEYRHCINYGKIVSEGMAGGLFCQVTGTSGCIIAQGCESYGNIIAPFAGGIACSVQSYMDMQITGGTYVAPISGEKISSLVTELVETPERAHRTKITDVHYLDIGRVVAPGYADNTSVPVAEAPLYAARLCIDGGLRMDILRAAEYDALPMVLYTDTADYAVRLYAQGTEEQGGRLYSIYTVEGIAPEELGDRLTLCSGATFTEYSVAQYLANIYEDSDAHDREIIVALVHYADAARECSRGETLLLEDFAAVTSYSPETDYISAGFAALELSGAAMSGTAVAEVALTADGDIQLVMRIADVCADTVTVTAGDERYTYGVRGGVAETDCLTLSDMDTVLTVRAAGHESQLSVSGYIASALASGTLSAAQENYLMALAVYMSVAG